MKTYRDILAEKKDKLFSMDQINVAMLKAGIGPSIIMKLLNVLNVMRGLGIMEADELTELFDTKIKLNVTTNDSSRFAAFFSVPAEAEAEDFEFFFSATKVGEDHLGDEWDIIFLRANAPEGSDSIGTFNDMTAKETLVTFSGVRAALMKWYNSQKPDTFAFTAKSSEGSRVKLYNKFAKLIAKKLNLKMISGPKGRTIKYLFSKKP